MSDEPGQPNYAAAKAGIVVAGGAWPRLRPFLSIKFFHE